MAYLHRLIAAAFMAAFSLSVQAAFPTSTGWAILSTTPPAYGTPEEACIARGAAGQAGGGRPFDHANPPTGISPNRTASCYWKNTTGAPSQDGAAYERANYCPANSTLASGSCTCKAGFEEDPTHTKCVASKGRWEKACEQNMGKRIDFRAAGKGLPGGCLTGINEVGSPIDGDTGGLPESFGCSIRFVTDGDVISAQDPDTKGWVTRGQGRVTGETCVAIGTGGVPNDAPEGTEEEEPGKPNDCLYGLVKGVNGSIVCAYDDPNGTIEGTETSSVKNPDGTTTDTKKDTKCDAGVCTTTTTTTTRDSAGNVTGVATDEKKESIGQTCSKDPGNKVCATTGGGGGEGGAGFSGTCAAGFVAKGEDPIANAMALEQHKRNCQYFEKKPDATDETNAYDAMLAKGKQGGDQTGDLPASSRRDVVIGPSDFDYSSAIGAQQCFTDRHVSIWGKSIAIPLSIACPWLEVLGNILVVVGSLLAARIVVRG